MTAKCLTQKEVCTISVVITGLVPVIQKLSAISVVLDCRNKPGNDTWKVLPALTDENDSDVL